MLPRNPIPQSINLSGLRYAQKSGALPSGAPLRSAPSRRAIIFE